ncbi:aromatic compound dioxygenase [Ophiobolus disseminans]|uniref:Aromatic compound dioxygenase n=1 Tax=Ophiobolus disseminans TaxID=1469910 RepID=A0A6A6ZRE7_9PLEO|nr:aromatic compound dioxygenase [Ophiobolus disseminans]
MAFNSALRLGLAIVALFFLITQVTAHLDLSRDELIDYYRNIKRDNDALSRCLKSPIMQEHNARILAHQNETLHSLRKARVWTPQDKLIGVNHEADPGHSRDPHDIFDFRWNNAPHQYAGCPQRADIRALQGGIQLRLAMQVIDYRTCMPLHGTQVDIWHSNAVGEYSDKMDGFLQGWQPISFQGTVDFDTTFPGHYDGRATHIHVVNIRDVIEEIGDYKKNKYAEIGESLEDDGLLGWITLGVDTSNNGIQQSPQKRNIVDWHLK